MFVLPGATPEQSVNNLYLWLDNLMIGLGCTTSLAMASNGQRIPGVFHKMSKEEFLILEEILTLSLMLGMLNALPMACQRGTC